MRLRVFRVLTIRRNGFAAISTSAVSCAHGPRLRDPFRRRGLPILLPAALVLLATAALASTAQAATLKVTTKADELTSCSLREAVAAVNAPGTKTHCGTASSTSNRIVLGAGHYALSSGQLEVTGTARLAVVGAGKFATVIDGGGLDRVLSIAAGATVTLRRLEVSGGHAHDGAAGASDRVTGGNGHSGGDGGGIYNTGMLSLVRVGVVGNTAGSGGAGGSDSGVCLFPPAPCAPAGGGGSGGDGGGIYNTGTLSVTHSTIGDNTAGAGGAGGRVGGCRPETRCRAPGSGGGGGSGGGIDNASPVASLTVTDSTIDRNQGGDGGGGGLNGGGGELNGGGGGAGGGISVTGGSLQVTNSTLEGNDAGAGGNGDWGAGGGAGGGISATGGSLEVTNSTLEGNAAGPGGSAGQVGGNGGDGGAIAASGLASTSLVQNATVANNAAGVGGPGSSGNGAAGSGGGLAASSALELQNTIVASNNANGAANCVGVTDGGHDLGYGDTSCPGINGDPLLQALADNGGATQTMALGSESPAIDQIPPTGAGCPATDQRGVKRPQGPACDIGAFELALPTVKVTTPARGAHYHKGQHVLAAYACNEGGIRSPIATCKGTVEKGKPIDTSSPGTYSFSVTATDKAGNTTTKTRHYTVR